MATMHSTLVQFPIRGALRRPPEHACVSGALVAPHSSADADARPKAYHVTVTLKVSDDDLEDIVAHSFGDPHCIDVRIETIGEAVTPDGREQRSQHVGSIKQFLRTIDLTAVQLQTVFPHVGLLLHALAAMSPRTPARQRTVRDPHRQPR